MQVARSPKRHGALDEATLDALAVDLTVPHPRPLVDLERDDYADLEVDKELATTRFERPEAPLPPSRPRPRSPSPTRKPPSWWSAAHVTAAVVTTALGFGLGAGLATLLS